MRPPRSQVPTAALLELAVALALASAAAARHPYAIVPPPAERAEEEVRRMYAAWKSEHGRRCGKAPMPHGAREVLGRERGRKREGGREKKLGFSWIQGL